MHRNSLTTGSLALNGDDKCVVELTVSCRELINMDILSKTDACVVAYIEQVDKPKQSKWKELGRTEVIWDNLNPEFSKKITLCYSPGERQRLKFRVYDVDDWTPLQRKQPKLKPENLVGRITVMLGGLVQFNEFSVYEEKLFVKGDPKPRGLLVIAAEVLHNRKNAFSLQFAAENLPPPKLLRQADAYFFELRKNMDGRQLLVYRSEPILPALPTNGSPKADNKIGPALRMWQSFQLTTFSLCSDDETKLLYLSLWKFKKNGQHKLIGTRETTLETLLNTENSGNNQNVYPMSIKGSAIRLVHIAKEMYAAFLDLVLHKGTFLHYFIGIDFSLSNGDLKSSESLHYLDGSKQASNPYIEALKAVYEVIECEDETTEVAVPLFGFGAKTPSDGEAVPSSFPLNGDVESPICFGIDEAIKAYKATLARISPQEPTNFAPLIKQIADIVSDYNDSMHYFALILFTDGDVTDLSETIDAIVAASGLPLSLMIVGVGRGPFHKMIKLDADKQSLFDSNGKRMQRDIVQFVNFDEVMAKTKGDLSMAQIALARELFYEAPTQFLTASPMTSSADAKKAPAVRILSAGKAKKLDEKWQDSMTQLEAISF